MTGMDTAIVCAAASDASGWDPEPRGLAAKMPPWALGLAILLTLAVVISLTLRFL